MKNSKIISAIHRLFSWRISFWWLPPRERRCFAAFKLPYDGYMYAALCLWIVHVGFRRRWDKNDFR